MNHYDLLVIGAGSGGFAAARLGHELGKKVAIVDGAEELGGLCILRGCMPSKALLYMAEVLHLAQQAGALGLSIPSASPDMKAIQARKARLIGEFADHRLQQLTSGKYTLYRSNARFENDHTLILATGERLTADRIVIATGSIVSIPPVPGLSETPAWTSDEVLALDFVPESVIVLGGGIVACELAQFLRRIGSKVILIQRSQNILRDHSPEASAVVQQSFRDEGIELHTDTNLQRVSGEPGKIIVDFVSSGTAVSRTAAFLFNALGRTANTSKLGLEKAGVKLDPTGRVLTNRYQQTNRRHIYAAGDVCGLDDVVHIAVAQGELAARHAFGVKKLKTIDPALTLNVVFTDPAVATIGVLESELRKKGIPYLSASYPFNDHGKSILMEANYGFVKVVAEPARGRILGAEIVGRDAGELIHAFSGPLAMKATVFDLLRAPWYHPTLAEILTYPLEEIADRLKQKHPL